MTPRAPHSPPLRSRFRARSSVFGIALLALTGCGRAPQEPAPPASGAPIATAAALSTNTLYVGDTFHLTVTVDYPAAGQIHIPEIANGKNLVIRDRRADSREIAPGRIRTVAHYALTSFAVGERLISSNEIVYTEAGSNVIRTLFPEARFTVLSALSRPDEPPRDIKGLARWPGRFPRWAIVLLLVAIIAGIAGALVRRFLAKPRTILQQPPPPPPHEVALAALRQLAAKRYIEELRIEPFYVELSGIARHYLEDRFGLRAPERTTEEFIREAITSRRLAPDHQALTRDFLEQCDLVKFARHEPQPADMRNAYGAAERLVRETIPNPAPPAAPAPEGKA